MIRTADGKREETRMQEESKEKSKDAPFESLRILSERWKNGTFSEIIDDWKWIFGYSARYKGAIVFIRFSVS